MRKNRNERQEAIKNYIKNRPGEYISTTVLNQQLELNACGSTIVHDFEEAAKMLGGVMEKMRSKGLMYVPVVDEKAKAEQNMKDSIDKAVAFFTEAQKEQETQREETRMDAKKPIEAGDIWQCEASNGSKEYVLVLKPFDEHSLCLKMTKHFNIYNITDDDIYVRLENKDPAYEELISTLYDPEERDKLEWAIESFDYGYFVNPTKICSKPNKYIKEFVVKSTKAEFDEVCAAVGNIFNDPGQELRDICDKAVAEAEAAKEELKKRETELEAEMAAVKSKLRKREAELEAKENAIYADLENAILKTKVEIYERLIFERGI